MKADHHRQAPVVIEAPSSSRFTANANHTSTRPSKSDRKKRKGRASDSLPRIDHEQSPKKAKYCRPELTSKQLDGCITDEEGSGNVIEQLRHARAERNQLRHALEESRRNHDADRARLALAETTVDASKQQEARTRQDLVFQTAFWQDKAARDVRLERQRNIRLMNANSALRETQTGFRQEINSLQQKLDDVRSSMSCTCDNLTQRLKAERDKYWTVRNEMVDLESALEYHEELRKTMEGDLIELQRLHNEEDDHRQHLVSGLPPAYGGLDDQDALPLLEHQDGGPAGRRKVLCLVRMNFAIAMGVAIGNATEKTDRSEEGTFLYDSASTALVEACKQLEKALEPAERLIDHNKEQSPSGYIDIRLVSTTSKGRPRWVWTDEPPLDSDLAERDQASIANEIAASLIEFSWYILAAHQARHHTVSMSQKLRTRTNLAWRRVDDTLLRALKEGCTGQSLTSGGSSRSIRQLQLADMQCFLTQLREIAKGLRELTTVGFFTESISWLSDSIECGRTIVVAEEIPLLPPTWSYPWNLDPQDPILTS